MSDQNGLALPTKDKEGNPTNSHKDNPDSPERDILMAEVEFRNLKNRLEGVDG